VHDGVAGADGRIEGDDIEAAIRHLGERVSLNGLGIVDVVRSQILGGKGNGALVDVNQRDAALGCELCGDDSDNTIAAAEVENGVRRRDLHVLNEQARARIDARAGEDAGLGGEAEFVTSQGDRESHAAAA